MNPGALLIIILIILLIGAFPRWPHSMNWGFYPSGGIGVIVVIILIMILIGRF